MKKKILIRLSLAFMSAAMLLETPVMAVSAASAQSAAVQIAEAQEENIRLTSRTEYGLINNGAYPSSTEQLIRRYIAENADLYLEKGLDGSFAYFNADAYLRNYPDIKKAILEQLKAEGRENDTAELRRRALLHYLQYGMLEGRQSGTTFDPVIALNAYPELYLQAQSLTPENVRNLFAEAIHVSDTTEFRIYFYYTGSNIEMLAVQRVRPGGASEETEESTQTSGGSEEENTPVVPAFVLPKAINNLAVDITPYRLYSRTGDSSKLSLPGTATTNYNSITNKSSKYTLMFYFSGTNLEDEDGSVTSSIADMMKSGADNLNIVLLIGGTDHFHNDYLNNSIGDGTEEADNREKVGIYYLNWSALKDVDVRNADYSELFNENTLINITTLDATNLGNAALLGGFVNAATELFPADDYGLIFWNHGGGVTGGVCSGDKKVVKDADALTVDELESGLRSTTLIKDGGKLGLLAFDTCLMGSTEVAFNLHNYYNYMIGSEELELGDFDYDRMLSEVNTVVAGGISTGTDSDVAQKIYENFSYYVDNDNYSHIGTSGLQATVGVYEGEAAENFVIALNTVAKSINSLVDSAEESRKNEILSTVAKARAKCETLHMEDSDVWNVNEMQFADIGDLSGFLLDDFRALLKKAKEAGDSQYAAGIQKVIDSLAALRQQGILIASSTWYDGTMVRTSSTYTGKVSMDQMSEEAKFSKLWTDTQGTNASYGTSVYFPYLFTLDEDEPTYSCYSKYYSGSTLLADYNQLMETMSAWKNSESYKTQLSNLKTEIKNINKFESVSVQNYGESGDTNQYFVAKLKDTYEGEAPADSFGDAAYDTFVSLAWNPKVLVSNDYTVSFTDGTSKIVKNRVILSDYISAEHFDIADSTINVQLDSLYGYGIVQNDSTPDWKLLNADAEDNGETKLAIVTALDYFKDYTNTTENSKKVKVLMGGGSNTEYSYTNLYHVFERTDNAKTEEYAYKGTVRKDDTVYSAMSDLQGVYFYDYYLKKTDEGATELANANTDYNYTSSSYSTSSEILLRKVYLKDYKYTDYEYTAGIEINYPDGGWIYEYSDQCKADPAPAGADTTPDPEDSGTPRDLTDAEEAVEQDADAEDILTVETEPAEEADAAEADITGDAESYEESVETGEDNALTGDIESEEEPAETEDIPVVETEPAEVTPAENAESGEENADTEVVQPVETVTVEDLEIEDILAADAQTAEDFEIEDILAAETEPESEAAVEETASEAAPEENEAAGEESAEPEAAPEVTPSESAEE